MSGVTESICEVVDSDSFTVSLKKVTQEEGIFEVLVSGMKNPPNFRKSGLFSDIKM